MNVSNGSGAMFSAIASRYDMLNRLTSFGFDVLWRTAAVHALSLPPDACLLDLAAGTADLSIEAARRHPDCRIAALDPSEGMLRIAKRKLQSAVLNSRVSPLCGAAESMPFSDATFDGVIIGFGIRNFSSRTTALSEIRRVLRPGGRLVILELSMPQGHFLSPFARIYVRSFVPLMGRIFSGGAPYSYLAESMRAFPPPERFSDELTRAGFHVAAIRSFMSGTCSLFVAEVAHDVR